MAFLVEFTKDDTIKGVGDFKKGDLKSVSRSIYNDCKERGTVKDAPKTKPKAKKE